MSGLFSFGRKSNAPKFTKPGSAPEIVPTEHYLVTRPCYLALRRALASHRRPHGVVVLLEPERSLTRSDIEDVLGMRVVATMAVQPATARLIDAGLLATQPMIRPDPG